MAALKSQRPDMEATVIGSLFQKLMILKGGGHGKIYSEFIV